MKSSEWQQALQQYREHHAKVVFTPTELANIAGQSMPVLKNTLPRLCRLGVLQKYASGRYGLPGAAQAEDLVQSIDAGAYITGLYALYRHGLVTQTPRRLHVFTNRRYNRSRIRKTALGSLVFICVRRPVYARPEGSVVTGPEQSLCDFTYVLRKQGLSAESLVTFRKLGDLDETVLERHLSRYPKTVGREVRRLQSTAVERPAHPKSRL